MADKNSSSYSSSSKSASFPIDDKGLLKFYQKKFEEHQKREDKYKEKIDKHLKNLVTDRHELEEEVLRRGEKISDLQKALVELQLSVFEERERFLKVTAENDELKRNEEILHTNIRELLAMTQQQDLRDKITYILKDPKVEIGYRFAYSKKSKSADTDFPANKKLKEELKYLQDQLNEVLNIPKNKSDAVLEDCKQVLQKSKEKIVQDEIQIKELQKILNDLNVQKSTSAKILPTESQLVKATPSVDSLSSICSQLKEIHLSLILLLKLITKTTNILLSIQATKLYHRLANIPRAPLDMQHTVEEDSILQLEKYFRQCTRLAFDINSMRKSLTKYVFDNKKYIQNSCVLRSELRHLEDMMKEITSLTADNDMLNMNLKQTSFFFALRDSSVAIEEDDRIQNINNFKQIVSNCNTLHSVVSSAVDFVESVIQKYNVKRKYWTNFADSSLEFSHSSVEPIRDTSRIRKSSKSDSELVFSRQEKSNSLEDLEKLLGIYKRTVDEAENLGFGTSSEAKLLSEKLKATQKKLEEEERLEKCDGNYKGDRMELEESQTQFKTSDCEEILRKINKTLSKVKLVQKGEYLKDEQLCKKLAENVNNLTKKFKELTEEFNVKSVQDQFSEYTRVTLSKLEELAKQSRNSVIAAESQISAHRSNAKHLSQKLKETEELLQESINECLGLKQKVKQVEEQHEMHKYALISDLRGKLEKVADTEELDKVLDELITYTIDNKGTKPDPFLCALCEQGMGHKLCQEEIRTLRAEARKSKTELKLLQRETKEEKENLKYYQSIAEKTAADLGSTNKDMKETIKTLESKNASLLERLKLEKNRIKNMERFRRFEIEGFQTDIKNLKTKIRDLEKQLLKAVLVFENNNKDMELLKTVHETAQRSKEATSALRRLKAKLYELENDIKSL